MFPKLTFFCVILCRVQYLVDGDTLKSSLTFVIDDTISMTDEIQQVKEKTELLFDAILKSNTSRIDEYVLVTFNDPGARIRAKTRDQNEFKRALSKISVHSNSTDCPEESMTGIELALENSRPNSFLYVYTDASAKDYKLYERVKSLSLKKSIQVTFLLTGDCEEDGNALVYNNLAAVTSGQVFNIEKHDVNKIMGHIIDSVKNIRTSLKQKYIKGDSEKHTSIQFNVDSKVWDIIVSVSAGNPMFQVIGPDGEIVETLKDKSIYTHQIKIEHLTVKPGVYTIVLDRNATSEGSASVLVTGCTLVTFLHGFSTFKPANLEETATKPIPDEKSYLAIKLDNYDKDIFLKTVELQDIDDNALLTLPLKLFNEDDQFYTTELFLPPSKGYKLIVTGYTKTGEKIIRLGTTLIEPQNIALEKEIEARLPSVTIVGRHNIDAEYDKPLSIKCKVYAFPKPDVVWHDSVNSSWPSKVVPVDLPYDYISILDIDTVKKNFTFTCKAVDIHGVSEASINVVTKRKNVFKDLRASCGYYYRVWGLV